jgi:N-acetylated-alpha-linked acidic dipeptidase
MRYAWLLLISAVPGLSQQPIRGFPPDEWSAQHEREDKAKAIPQTGRIQIYMQRIASKPHHAGSPGSKAVADYLAAQLKDWHLDVRTEDFEALLPYPTVRLLEMTAPVKFRAQLKEPSFPEDADTAEAGQLPTYNAYSATGDVTAPLVYVNYGVPEDYAELKRLGLDVKGKIVIARYGRSWRGVKVKLAQENGAVGCLIYSDPRDDGYFQGDVYPKGPMRPDQGVQRGSVLDMAIYPGDPLSPGWASEPGSKRLTPADAKSLPKIPVLPISYGDAKPLLEQLTGTVVPETWRGALPITYHIGPGPATVHLKLDFDWSTRPLHDVIAIIPGSVYRDQWVMYGNHHDAWVNGAADPASGAAVLMETARTLSVLRQQGWQPKRTIVLALWDGEEFGLMGSTEWAEKHFKDLERNAALYINSDLTGRGALNASGAHSLEAFLSEVLRDIPDPSSSRSLLDVARSRRRTMPDGSASDFRISPLGSGSDYVPFIDHSGVASMNLGFGGADSGGVYHSTYDTVGWFERFSDSDLSFGKALSQIMTTSILRFADSAVLPFEFSSLGRAVRTYTDEIQREAQKHSGTVDFREVQAELTRLDAAARAYEEELGIVMKHTPAVPLERLAKANETLQRAERTLLLADGLPGREWYRHQIYAPGLYTGYDPKTLPGVREAVEAQHTEEANQQAKRVAQTLRALEAQVTEATRLLTRAGS